MADPAPIRDAATVVLLKESLPGPPRVFLVRRHAKSRFMGGQYVFPGGKRDEDDSGPALLARTRGLTPEAAGAMLEMAPGRAIGHFVAAVRETFEEAGVLCAVDAAGGPVDPATVSTARETLEDEGLLAILERHDWYLDLACLRYFSHWVTPPVEPRRYSARFFLTRVPGRQVAAHDQVETTDGRWFTAAEAVSAYQDGHIGLPPPQLRTLDLLTGCADLTAAMASAPHEPVSPCAPHFIAAKPPMLVLHGDPLHPDDPGERLRRFALEDRRWTAYFD